MKNVKVGTDAMVVLDKNYYYFKSFEIEKNSRPKLLLLQKSQKSKNKQRVRKIFKIH